MENTKQHDKEVRDVLLKYKNRLCWNNNILMGKEITQENYETAWYSYAYAIENKEQMLGLINIAGSCGKYGYAFCNWGILYMEKGHKSEFVAYGNIEEIEEKQGTKGNYMLLRLDDGNINCIYENTIKYDFFGKMLFELKDISKKYSRKSKEIKINKNLTLDDRVIIVKQYLSKIAPSYSKFYYGDSNIPPKIKKAVLKKYKISETKERILGIVDNSLLNNGKVGGVFTDSAFYWSEDFSLSQPIDMMRYDDLKLVVLMEKEQKEDDYLLLMNHYDLKSHEVKYNGLKKAELKDMLNELKSVETKRVYANEESYNIQENEGNSKNENDKDQKPMKKEDKKPECKTNLLQQTDEEEGKVGNEKVLEEWNKETSHNENKGLFADPQSNVGVSDKLSQLEYGYLINNIYEIAVIKENDKVRIAKVEYEDYACIYKIYYGRDLTSIYKLLMENKTSRCLAQIYKVVYFNGDTHIIEERLSGENLGEYIENRGPLTDEMFKNIITDVCDALIALHESVPVVLHRDIKPSNIMLLKDGGIKLFDFDAARTYNGDKDKDTILLGTKGYAPPEQFGFSETGAYSDIYSLGVTMYEMLTGEILESNVSKRIYKCDDRYKEIIDRCVKFDINQRYQTVRELKVDLEKAFEKKNFVSKNINIEYEKILDVERFKNYIYATLVKCDLSSKIRRFTYKDDETYQKKLKQVNKMIKYFLEDETLEIVYDDSMTNNGKCGMVVTNKRIIDIYLDKSIVLWDVRSVSVKGYYIILESDDKEIKIPCTGGDKMRETLKDGLVLLLQL